MKRLIVLLSAVMILVTGCSAVKLDTADIGKNIKNLLSKKVDLYNVHFDGYKYYVPKGLKFLHKEEYNASFIDKYNFDMKSMQKECVHIVTKDLKRIPFSSYNIFLPYLFFQIIQIDVPNIYLEKIKNVPIKILLKKYYFVNENICFFVFFMLNFKNNYAFYFS